MDDRIAKGIDRRTFLKLLGITGGALVIPGAVACGGPAVPTPAPTTSAPTAAATTAASAGGAQATSPATAVSAPATKATGAAASPSAASGTANVPFYNGTFTVAMLQNPQGLDPQVNTNTESFQVMLGVFEQLIDYDPNTDKFYPQLIEQMPDLSNPLEYTFKLRKGVKFHDGSELTGDDVKYTFDYVLAKGPKAPPYSLYSALDKVTVVDPYTVKMNLKSANAMFIPYLASVMGGIVKKGAREKQDLTRDPSGAGSGPFKFVEWVNADHVTLEKFDSYFRTGYPKFQKLIYRIVVDDSARVAQLLSGGLDFNGFVSPKDYQRVTTTAGMKGIPGKEGTKIDYVLINNINDLGKDPYIRRAMAYAIDGNAIVKSVLYGEGTAGVGPVRPGTKWYDPAVEKSAGFDIAKAQAELKKSTKPNGFTFDLYCENNPYITQQATLIQAMLGKIGITANVTPMEKVAFYDKVAKDKPDWFAGITNWTSSVNTPDYMIKLVYTTNGSYQRSGYSNPTVDKMVQDLEQVTDEAQQKALMSKIQIQMTDDMPAIWFAWEDWLPAWKDYVKGYKPTATYYQYFDEVAIAPH